MHDTRNSRPAYCSAQLQLSSTWSKISEFCYKTEILKLFFETSSWIKMRQSFEIFEIFGFWREMSNISRTRLEYMVLSTVLLASYCSWPRLQSDHSNTETEAHAHTCAHTHAHTQEHTQTHISTLDKHNEHKTMTVAGKLLVSTCVLHCFFELIVGIRRRVHILAYTRMLNCACVSVCVWLVLVCWPGRSLRQYVARVRDVCVIFKSQPVVLAQVYLLSLSMQNHP